MSLLLYCDSKSGSFKFRLKIIRGLTVTKNNLIAKWVYYEIN